MCVSQLGLISSITLKYALGGDSEEPFRLSAFAYQSSFSIASAFWVAQVMTPSGQPVTVNGKLVYASWSQVGWPPPGGAFGSSGTPEITEWDDIFAYYSGGVKLDGYVDATNARAIFQTGFTLDRLRIVRVGEYPVLY